MSLIRILENDDWIVDYNRERGQYRVSYFEDNHFRDELWFDTYAEEWLREKDIAIPVKRFDNYNHEWWTGLCPRCGNIIRFDFDFDPVEGNRKCYCSKCGQSCDFEDR